MNALSSFMRRGARLALAFVAVAAAALLLAQDRTGVGASHTEILQSMSSTTPTWNPSIVLLNGVTPGSLLSPCNPSETDPTTGCMFVWAKNVDNSSGASAFQLSFTYNSTMLDVTSFIYSTIWLGSTGRSVACASPLVDPHPETGVGQATISCNTLLPPPPFGPNCANGHCSGLLGWFTIKSRPGMTGITTVNFSGDSFLVDTPANPDNLTRIPATVRSVNVVVAPCSDYNADNTVRVNDILYVVGKFGTNNPEADLNGSGTVLVDDILISVAQFGLDCPQ